MAHSKKNQNRKSKPQLLYILLILNKKKIVLQLVDAILILILKSWNFF